MDGQPTLPHLCVGGSDHEQVREADEDGCKQKHQGGEEGECDAHVMRSNSGTLRGYAPA